MELQGQGSAGSIPSLWVPMVQASFVLPQSCYGVVAAACGRWGEQPLFSHLSGSAVQGHSWSEVLICHLPGFIHPQTRNRRCKA